MERSHVAPSTPWGGADRSVPLWAVVLVAVSVGVVGTIVTLNLVAWALFPHTGPSSFYPVGIERAPAGAIGCATTSSEVCYVAEFGTSFSDLRLGDLRFSVTSDGPASPNGPSGPSTPLGSSAGVTVLSAPNESAGHWSFVSGSWTSGSTWSVPTNANIKAVLDTGLQSNATLGSTMFWIVVSGPQSGAVGLPLGCGGC